MKFFSAASFALSALALCAVCAASMYVHGRISALEEGSSLSDSSAPRMAVDGTGSARVAELEARIDAIESALPLLRAQAGRQAKGAVEPPANPAVRVDAEAARSPRVAQGGDPAGESGPAGASPAGRPESIEMKVTRLEKEFEEIRKKIEDREGENGKPKFGKFAAMMDLTPAQAQASHDILEKGQSQVLELMKVPLADGTVMADKLAEAFSSAMDGSEEGKARVGELFKTLITEKVPGSDETYLAAIERVNREIASRMDTVLNVDQQRKFREWGVKPTDIEIDNGPFQRHIIEYIKATKGNGK